MFILNRKWLQKKDLCPTSQEVIFSMKSWQGRGRAPSLAPPALHTQAGSRSLLKNTEADSPRKPSLICEEVKIGNGLEMTSLTYWSPDSWEGTGEGAWGRGGSSFPHKGNSMRLTRMKRTFSSGSAATMPPGGARGKEPTCQSRSCTRCTFDP